MGNGIKIKKSKVGQFAKGKGININYGGGRFPGMPSEREQEFGHSQDVLEVEKPAVPSRIPIQKGGSQRIIVEHPQDRRIILPSRTQNPPEQARADERPPGYYDINLDARRKGPPGKSSGKPVAPAERRYLRPDEYSDEPTEVVRPKRGSSTDEITPVPKRTAEPIDDILPLPQPTESLTSKFINAFKRKPTTGRVGARVRSIWGPIGGKPPGVPSSQLPRAASAKQGLASRVADAFRSKGQNGRSPLSDSPTAKFLIRNLGSGKRDNDFTEFSLRSGSPKGQKASLIGQGRDEGTPTVIGRLGGYIRSKTGLGVQRLTTEQQAGIEDLLEPPTPGVASRIRNRFRRADSPASPSSPDAKQLESFEECLSKVLKSHGASVEGVGNYRQRLMRLYGQPELDKARFDREVYRILKRAGADERKISYIKNPPAFNSIRFGIKKQQELLERLRYIGAYEAIQAETRGSDGLNG